MIQNSDEVYLFPELRKFKQITHAFSTRKFGSMNPNDVVSKKNLEEFAKTLNIPIKVIVRMEQVHSGNVCDVDGNYKTRIIKRTDGLYTNKKNTFLSVVCADCIPVMICDPFEEVIGIVHAGWKGIYNEIMQKMIHEMIVKGAKKENLSIALGPSIHSCCYSIDKKRAALFKRKFPKWTSLFLSERDGVIYCSLQTLLIQQLKAEGVEKSRIYDSNICTKDEHNTFYSYRADARKMPLDEFIGIIGIRP